MGERRVSRGSGTPSVPNGGATAHQSVCNLLHTLTRLKHSNQILGGDETGIF